MAQICSSSVSPVIRRGGVEGGGDRDKVFERQAEHHLTMSSPHLVKATSSRWKQTIFIHAPRIKAAGTARPRFSTAADGGPVATRQLLKCCENNGAGEVEKVAAAEDLLAAEDGVCRQGRSGNADGNSLAVRSRKNSSERETVLVTCGNETKSEAAEAQCTD